jgi:monoamine oxidase
MRRCAIQTFSRCRFEQIHVTITTPTQVAIMGGGLAGLHAAHLLHRAGVSFQLFEARDRLGGRILTVDDAGCAHVDGFDLGPSWFWPDMQPALSDLIDELGLGSFAQHTDGDMLYERGLRERPHRMRGMEQEPRSMRLIGGSASLIRALASNLPKDALHMGAAVTYLRLAEDGIELTCERDGLPPQRTSFSHVIAALPPRLLAAAIKFEPAVEAASLNLWQSTPTWMAPHAKFFALYDRPFWREAGLSGAAQSMVGPLGEIHDATTDQGRAALFGFVGISAAQRASVGRERLIGAAIQQLTRLFGSEAAQPRATLLNDWTTDVRTSTPADHYASGHPSAARAAWVTGQWAKRLILAGSETSSTEPGYLAGAVEASQRAVATVRSSLQANLHAPFGAMGGVGI